MGKQNVSDWVEISRSILQWELYRNVNAKIVFIHLITMSAHKPYESKDMHVDRGQVFTSSGKISSEVNNMSAKQAMTALKNLTMSGVISLIKYKSGALITILKYVRYAT